MPTRKNGSRSGRTPAEASPRRENFEHLLEYFEIGEDAAQAPHRPVGGPKMPSANTYLAHEEDELLKYIGLVCGVSKSKLLLLALRSFMAHYDPPKLAKPRALRRRK